MQHNLQIAASMASASDQNSIPKEVFQTKDFNIGIHSFPA